MQYVIASNSKFLGLFFMCSKIIQITSFLIYIQIHKWPQLAPIPNAGILVWAYGRMDDGRKTLPEGNCQNKIVIIGIWPFFLGKCILLRHFPAISIREGNSGQLGHTIKTAGATGASDCQAKFFLLLFRIASNFIWFTQIISEN